WPRPSGGFLDLGCGNGSLTHILSAEGHSGYGIDLRARTSWAHYFDLSQAALKVHALNPTQLLSPDSSNDEEKSFWKPGVFLIGNHADELTPWLPVLATLAGASGYLSIPCCAWVLLVKLFASANCRIRIALLDNLPDFAEKLDKKTVVDKIWPILV
ncbi:hypothetical protein BDR03DRAFT_1046544, partial [Suillus americanus]